MIQWTLRVVWQEYLNIIFCFTIHIMVSPILEFIVWLIFSKYSFQKTIFYFPDLKQDFENGLRDVFRIQKMFLMT